MKLKKYILLAAGFALFQVSCNKYLEVDPDNRAELNSPAALRELLATAYPQASYVMIAESMSDNFADKGIFASSIVNPVNRDVYLYKENIQSTAEDSPDYQDQLLDIYYSSFEKEPIQLPIVYIFLISSFRGFKL